MPGHEQDIDTHNYRPAIRAIERRGYAVVFVPINWADTTVEDWVHEFDEVYEGYNPDDVILAGFSAGAMIAFICAAPRNPSALWLFSLSPYFAEDLQSPLMDPLWLEGVGPRRVESSRQLHFDELAASIKCPTLLMDGEVEIARWPIMGERLTKAHRRLESSRLVVAKDADHDITSQPYITALEASI